MDQEAKVVKWFNAMDWIQAGSRIAAILVVTFILVFIARRLISGLEKFTATHAHDTEAQRRAATVSNVLRKLATILISVLATLATYSNLNKAAGYQLRTINVAGFAGQTVTLKFTGVEDSSLQTSFVVDDTALTVS